MNESEGLKPRLIEWLKLHHAEISIDRRPKQRSIITVSFDQGVYKGKNVYTVRYDKLNPLWCAMICFEEGWNNIDKINAAILSALEIET
jgi:hypothetical protein